MTQLTRVLETYGISGVMDGFQFGDFKRAWEERFTEDPPLDLDCFTNEPGASARDKFESTLLDCQARIEYLQEELAQQEFIAEYLTIAIESKGALELDPLSESTAPTSSLLRRRCEYDSPTPSVRDRKEDVVDGVQETDIDTVTDVEMKFCETRLSTTDSTNASPKWTKQDSEELKNVHFSTISVSSNTSDIISFDNGSASSYVSSPDMTMLRRDRDTVMSNALDSPVVCPPPQAYKEERIYDEPFAVVKGEVDESAESSDEEPVYYNVLLMKHQSMAASHGPVYANAGVLEKKRGEMTAKSCRGKHSPSKLDTSLSPSGTQ